MARKRVHDRKRIAEELYQRMAVGMLVKDACAELGVLPTKVSEWAAQDAEFREVYARAREAQAHAFAEQAIDIATGDDPLTIAREEAIEDYAEEIKGESSAHQKIRALENNLIQRDKLRVDTLKWYTSKIAPRHYGEKQQVEHQGGVSVRVEYGDSDE